jgi:hypothetical protein
MDIVSLARKINRAISELIHSQSSPVSEFHPADWERLQSYVMVGEAYKAWIVDQPVLDLPESHPTMYPLPENPQIPPLENECLSDLVGLLIVLRTELVNSSSARVGSGLGKFDSARFDATMGKIKKYMTDFVQKIGPVDLPETTPSAPMTPVGNLGV